MVEWNLSKFKPSTHGWRTASVECVCACVYFDLKLAVAVVDAVPASCRICSRMTFGVNNWIGHADAETRENTAGCSAAVFAVVIKNL